jgi:hypothetical protein
VICGKTQGQVARVPSRDILKRMSDDGVKCACGRAIADERIEEALSITDLGRTLLDGSRWLTLLVVEQLQLVGVPLNRILIEQQVGSDELDCLADISGDFVLFELKDKDFNLGNAYSFGAKMQIIRPDHAVIFSTQKIGNDAREHFGRARLARNVGLRTLPSSDGERAEILYFEGLDQLRGGIEALATDKYRQHAVRALKPVLDLAAIPAAPLISALEHRTSGQIPAGEVTAEASELEQLETAISTPPEVAVVDAASATTAC